VTTTAGKKYTAGFVVHRENYGSWWVIPTTGAASGGTGTVWEKPTWGLPVISPKLYKQQQMAIGYDASIQTRYHPLQGFSHVRHLIKLTSVTLRQVF